MIERGLNCNNEKVFSSLYDIYGNTSISEAEIVIVTDIPVDPKNKESNAALINQIWHKHQIIVQDAPFGMQVKANENSLTFGLGVEAVIQGCELPKLHERLKQFELEEQEIQAHVSNVKFHLEKTKSLSIHDTLEAFLPLSRLVSDNLCEEIRKFSKIAASLSYQYFMQRVYSLLHAIQADFKEKVKNYHQLTFQTRQELLTVAIEDGLNIHQKVIVCLNASHIIRNPSMPGKEYDVDFLRDYLETKKFVIINIKNSSLSLPLNMPQLWRQQCEIVPPWIEEMKKQMDEKQKEEDDTPVVIMETTIPQGPQGIRSPTPQPIKHHQLIISDMESMAQKVDVQSLEKKMEKDSSAVSMIKSPSSISLSSLIQEEFVSGEDPV